MNALLKRDADALWEEALSNVGFLERKALNRKREMIYALIQKHFGNTYALLDHMNVAGGGAE